MQRLEFANPGFARSPISGQRCKAQRVPVKPPFFEKAAEFDGTIAPRPGFRKWNAAARVHDVSLVRGVEENDGFVFEGVFHPGFELLARGDGAGRVVRRAEINQVNVLSSAARG